ncbi:MAG: hypothetical protein K2O94_03430 [Clostridiales bacterium]|nr:hypothetical protein [Clostridiales bacterium]
MINKQAKERLYSVVLALLLLAVMLVGGRCISFAFADTPQFTSALTDLQKDSNFNAADYPDKAKDYSIQVIQIAESTDKKLFVYTYQPSQATTYIVATEINMSLSESVDGTQLYGLTLLSSDGVFCKYIVNDITVSDETVRYYNITCIYRDWLKNIDKPMDNDNTKNSVSFDVGRLYKVYFENDTLLYFCKDTETIEILNPFVDYLEYSNGFKFFPDWCRSHYIAFSTDRDIDYLLEADVSYIRRDASRSTGIGLDGKTHYKNKRDEIAKLNGEQKGGNSADGWFAKKYEWERIQPVKDFIDQENLKEETKTSLDGAKWVLRFVETEIWLTSGYGTTTTFWTDISEVSVLRLKFVKDGIVYNLGAVSDKVTGDDRPGNTNTNELASLWEWFSRLTGIPEWLWKLLLVGIVLVICLPVLSLIFPVIGQVLSIFLKALLKAVVWLFKGLWWLICLPFKGIAALVGKIRERKGDNVV